jgi:hypothetical protein
MVFVWHVMAGPVPAIHVFLIFFLSQEKGKTWMPATSAGMTWIGVDQYES